MELSEKYVRTVSTLGSFSAAAHELFISQPALSAAISRHEKSLGFKIFDRSVIPLTLTPEGKIYIEHLEEKEKSENLMRLRIKMLSDASYGAISVGVYSYSATELLSIICGKFNEKYPNVKVRLDMGSIGGLENLSEKMRNHALDIMLNYSCDSSECIGVPILTENMVVAMHKDMIGASEIAHLATPREKIISGELEEKDFIADLSVFKDIKFFQYSNFSNTRHKMDRIFGSYKIASYTVENARQVNMHNKLMCQKVGAIITTDFHIKTNDFDNRDILYFLPKSEHLERTLYIITPKNTTMSPSVKNFLELSLEVASKYNK